MTREIEIGLSATTPGKLDLKVVKACKENAFKEVSLIEVVRGVISEHCGIDMELVQDTTVYEVLVSTFLCFADKPELVNFLKKLFFRSDTIGVRDAMSQMISVLVNLQVYDGDRVLIDLAVE